MILLNLTGNPRLDHKLGCARLKGAVLIGDPSCARCVQLGAVKPRRRSRRIPKERTASREEQYGRYLDCGPAAWDDR